MLRCGNVPAVAVAVNAVAETEGELSGGYRIGRVNGSVLESPPSTAKAWPLT